MRPVTNTLTAMVSACLLLTTACSKKPTDSSEAASAATDAAADTSLVSSPQDDTVASAETGPDIGNIVAPGVAFAYTYAFTLPAKAIADVQQQHAAACERLGASRCRVTGMNYAQPREGDVTARLDFLLAPDLAHRFGSEGIEAVEKADGHLDNAAVNGEDSGSAIKISQQNSAGLSAELARIDARLTAKGLSRGEREDLSVRAEEMRQQLRGEEQGRRSKEAAIASTPVSFAYSSEGLLGSGGNPFGKAAAASWGSAKSALSIMLLVAGIALPWLLLIGLIALIWRSPDLRRVLRRLFGASSAEPDLPPAQ